MWTSFLKFTDNTASTLLLYGVAVCLGFLLGLGFFPSLIPKKVLMVVNVSELVWTAPWVKLIFVFLDLSL